MTWSEAQQKVLEELVEATQKRRDWEIRWQMITAEYQFLWGIRSSLTTLKFAQWIDGLRRIGRN